VLGDRDLAARLGSAAERRVREHFSLEAMLSALDALYRSELARAGVAVATTSATDAQEVLPVGRASIG
jgi:hypothetical protein